MSGRLIAVANHRPGCFEELEGTLLLEPVVGLVFLSTPEKKKSSNMQTMRRETGKIRVHRNGSYIGTSRVRVMLYFIIASVLLPTRKRKIEPLQRAGYITTRRGIQLEYVERLRASNHWRTDVRRPFRAPFLATFR